MPVTAVHLINTDVLPTFEQHKAQVTTILSDNGRKFCGRPDRRHPYELLLHLEEIEHRTTRIKRPQSNGLVERLHRTLLHEIGRATRRESECQYVYISEVAVSSKNESTTSTEPNQDSIHQQLTKQL